MQNTIYIKENKLKNAIFYIVSKTNFLMLAVYLKTLSVNRVLFSCFFFTKGNFCIGNLDYWVAPHGNGLQIFWCSEKLPSIYKGKKKGSQCSIDTIRGSIKKLHKNTFEKNVFRTFCLFYNVLFVVSFLIMD